jgi:amino acid efflux transporter
MVAGVLAANATGLHTTARLQLGLAAALATLLLVAVVTALPEGRAGHWTPFAPHGWTGIGAAASLLMFSFIGWEAGSHLAGEFRDPARQLPRALLAALAIVVILYLGLAVTTVGVLGTAAPSDVPLADLMAAGLGTPGRATTAVLAVLLTMGTMNAYVAAATKLAGALSGEGVAPAPLARPRVGLGLLAAVAAGELALLAVGVLDVEGLVRASSASFVAVYAPATAAGFRLLRGGVRWAAGASLAAMLVILAFSGPYLLVPVAIAAIACRFAQRPRAPALKPSPTVGELSHGRISRPRARPLGRAGARGLRADVGGSVASTTRLAPAHSTACAPVHRGPRDGRRDTIRGATGV